jgi:hypothetical protein
LPGGRINPPFRSELTEATEPTPVLAESLFATRNQAGAAGDVTVTADFTAADDELVELKLALCAEIPVPKPACAGREKKQA